MPRTVIVSGGFDPHNTVEIKVNDWHQLQNPSDKVLRVIEIQYGEHCVEEDIERIVLLQVADKDA